MAKLMLYRGIAVPSAVLAETMSSIRKDGLFEWRGTYHLEQLWRVPSGVSVDKAGLTLAEVEGADWRPCCACGTLEGAEYYAWQHSRKDDDHIPILIQFEPRLDQVKVDGRDFLYFAFQKGDPSKARGCRQSNLVQIAMARIWQMAR